MRMAVDEFDRQAPANAWLLLADESSWPTPQTPAGMRENTDSWRLDNLWTAPIDGAPGDLALLYFIAPIKAICFVARIADHPFWSDEIKVNALAPVGSQQWWAPLTPLIEIEPIPFADIQATQEKTLVLRGRTGKPLSSASLARLEFKAVNPDQQEQLQQTIRGGAIVRHFVIALNSDAYADDSPAVDLVRVTAEGYDHPITHIEPAGDPRAFDLIKSFVDEDRNYTVRQAVGMFGVRGMYREVSGHQHLS